MNICCFQHVPFEGLGCINDWVVVNNHNLRVVKLYDNDPLPAIDEIDFLIVLGGPMGVFDDKVYPWLISEKQFVKQSIRANKIVLGICLGAQLIADVLGAEVYPNKEKEIGWHPINLNTSFQSYVGANTDVNLTTFHWHGDTFNIPEGAMLHSSSSSCANQLFSYNKKVVGIQCHLEITRESLHAIVSNCKNELLEGGNFVQSEKQIIETTQYIQQSNQIMFQLLDTICS